MEIYFIFISIEIPFELVDLKIEIKLKFWIIII